ncbi:MarR family winged helix-turn-helix transcriptional regulator [Pseudonocardia sp.]|jgi:DNA-binding MarR family transcriptional regulator|uniref:MarR family winged helix-turn-helix transcriptional regulator n=1 Tax=Pseudonocardia sp. TaxID=60912 RepID=UPI0031FDB688
MASGNPALTAPPPGPGEEDLALADRVARALIMLIRLVKRVGAHRAEAELESAAFPVLAHLAVDGPQRSGEIAAAMCADPSTISRQVAGLVKAGLVERRADPGDGRATLLATTTDGTRILDLERRRRAEQLATALSGWTPEHRTQLAELLSRFVTDLQVHEQGGTR